MHPTEAHPLLWTCVATLALVRAYELILSRVHERRLLARGGARYGPDGFLPILASQTVLFSGLVVEGILVHPGARVWLLSIPFLGVALGALALRHWCIWTLGDHWTVFVITVPGARLVRRGPYRFLRHPNYLAVFVELLALPLAFQLWWTAAACLVVGGPALLNRVHHEERALAPFRQAASQELATIDRRQTT